MTSGVLFVCVALYVVIGRACLDLVSGRARIILFSLTNLVGVVCLIYTPDAFQRLVVVVTFSLYVGLVALQYFALCRFANRKGWLPWIAFFIPVAALILIKYVPPLMGSLWLTLGMSHSISHAEFYFIGISYLAFRSSRLVLDVRNNVVPKPGFWEYLAFCFFVPTMTVGPINSYGEFMKGFSGADRTVLPVGRSALRILVGLVKFIVLAHFCEQLSYQSLLLDGHLHHRVDFLVAAAFYYLYLYCNFSGFCDIAIGVAGLLGFPVEENFRDPLGARNLQEFWNRWHITLSQYMRDVVFTPLCKWLIGIFGVSRSNAAIAAAIFVVFLLVGIWHGVGWNFVLFGAAHGLGLVIVHYYGIGMKKWLGKERFKRYLQNGWARAFATVLTFAYVSGCLFLFANDLQSMRKIFSVFI